jgi:hypothetical protein
MIAVRKTISCSKTLQPFPRNIQNMQVCALHEPSCSITDPASLLRGTVHVHCFSSDSRLQLVRTHGFDTLKTPIESKVTCISRIFSGNL